MSIVKYTNKKTGVVTWYESTSHYDPDTKQSRPIRKYLGKEDPVTGELIPSSGKRGRKSSSGPVHGNPSANAAGAQASTLSQIRDLEKEIRQQQARIEALEAENHKLLDVIRQSESHLKQLDSLYSSVRKANS